MRLINLRRRLISSLLFVFVINPLLTLPHADDTHRNKIPYQTLFLALCFERTHFPEPAQTLEKECRVNCVARLLVILLLL